MEIQNTVLTIVYDSDISQNGVFTVPEGITKIGDNAFAGCQLLKTVELSNGITTIGENAFRECHSLEKVNLPESLREIKDYAFAECISLREIKIPDGVTKIGSFAFSACELLEKIRLPEKLKVIRYDTFRFCSSLREIYISKSEIEYSEQFLNSNPFYHCDNLEKIFWKDQMYFVKCMNGHCFAIITKEILHDMTIYKCSHFPKGKIVYIIEKGNFAAYGDSIEKATENLILQTIHSKD